MSTTETTRRSILVIVILISSPWLAASHRKSRQRTSLLIPVCWLNSEEAELRRNSSLNGQKKKCIQWSLMAFGNVRKRGKIRQRNRRSEIEARFWGKTTPDCSLC